MRFEKLYKICPVIIQNLIISVYNYLAYKKRYGGRYKEYLDKFKTNYKLTLDELFEIQQNRYAELVKHSMKNSKFYNEIYSTIHEPYLLKNIKKLPVINKEMIRSNAQDVYTLKKEDGHVSKTGGTTGKSLEVVYTLDNIQERIAMLDAFRNQFGYQLGKKTAWFSGKDILTKRDVKRQRFWKTDVFYRVRYYSTFHIQNKFLDSYLKNLIKFKPEYIVGFPSSILDIANYGLNNNFEFPLGVIKAIFPTAEKIDRNSRMNIEKFFKTKVYDQYASSEGAPFIIECHRGNLHIEMQSGVFEVLGDENEPADSGRLVVTAFATLGTPLIRYDIGDSIVMSSKTCDCGNNNPLVKEILGRGNDFIYSRDVGKINLGNLSNVLKDVRGVVKFQITQDRLDELQISIVRDKGGFDSSSEKKFIKNLRARVGTSIKIEIVYTKQIANEASGKYRLIKNNIKSLIPNE